MEREEHSSEVDRLVEEGVSLYESGQVRTIYWAAFREIL